MPSLQEMLVSYAVKIDESGVSRLHTVLDQNRKKANETAAAFAALESAVGKLGKVLDQFSKRFPNFGLSGSASGLVTNIASSFGGGGQRPEGVPADSGQRTRELSRFASVLSESIKTSVSTVTNRTNTYIGNNTATGTTFPLQADTSPVQTAVEELNRFLVSKAPTMKLKGDASGLISAASNAASRVQSILSDLNFDLGGSGSGGSPPTMHYSSSGGRFARPTTTQVAEDGDTEYIIPVNKDKKAVPLITQMMGELSFNAYQNVLYKLGINAPTNQGSPFEKGELSLGRLRGSNPPTGETRRALSLANDRSHWPSLSLSDASALASMNIQNRYEVSAPVTISVQSSGTDAKQVGEAAYNAAERQLLKSIRGVMQ